MACVPFKTKSYHLYGNYVFFIPHVNQFTFLLKDMVNDDIYAINTSINSIKCFRPLHLFDFTLQVK